MSREQSETVKWTKTSVYQRAAYIGEVELVIFARRRNDKVYGYVIEFRRPMRSGNWGPWRTLGYSKTLKEAKQNVAWWVEANGGNDSAMFNPVEVL